MKISGMHEREQVEWAEAAVCGLREMLSLMEPFASHRFEDRAAAAALGELASASARSSESAMLLCAFGQLWDAELVMRSVVEASLKFCFILQSPEHFPERMREYREDLHDIGVLKGHNKISEFLGGIASHSDAQVRPLVDRLLAPEELTRLQDRLPRQKRNIIEQRWGFSAMVGVLDRSGDPIFAGIAGLAHGYAMASHVMHADPIGVSMPMERDHRAPDRRDAAHSVHLARLILDATAFQRMRLVVAYRFLGLPVDGLTRADEIVEAAARRQQAAYQVFAAREYREPTP